MLARINTMLLWLILLVVALVVSVGAGLISALLIPVSDGNHLPPAESDPTQNDFGVETVPVAIQPSLTLRYPFAPQHNHASNASRRTDTPDAVALGSDDPRWVLALLYNDDAELHLLHRSVDKATLSTMDSWGGDWSSDFAVVSEVTGASPVFNSDATRLFLYDASSLYEYTLNWTTTTVINNSASHTPPATIAEIQPSSDEVDTLWVHMTNGSLYHYAVATTTWTQVVSSGVAAFRVAGTHLVVLSTSGTGTFYTGVTGATVTAHSTFTFDASAHTPVSCLLQNSQGDEVILAVYQSSSSSLYGIEFWTRDTGTGTSWTRHDLDLATHVEQPVVCQAGPGGWWMTLPGNMISFVPRGLAAFTEQEFRRVRGSEGSEHLSCALYQSGNANMDAAAVPSNGGASVYVR